MASAAQGPGRDVGFPQGGPPTYISPGAEPWALHHSNCVHATCMHTVLRTISSATGMIIVKRKPAGSKLNSHCPRKLCSMSCFVILFPKLVRFGRLHERAAALDPTNCIGLAGARARCTDGYGAASNTQGSLFRGVRHEFVKYQCKIQSRARRQCLVPNIDVDPWAEHHGDRVHDVPKARAGLLFRCKLLVRLSQRISRPDTLILASALELAQRRD